MRPKLTLGVLTAAIRVRFGQSFTRGSGSECWEWRGVMRPNGYGTFNHARQSYLSHRVAYEDQVGPIPAGLYLDHVCRNRRCVNPAHLEPVTHRQNTLRGVGEAARHARARRCPKGHPYDAVNTLIRRKGWRECLTCRRAAQLTLNARRRGDRACDTSPRAAWGGARDVPKCAASIVHGRHRGQRCHRYARQDGLCYPHHRTLAAQ